MASIELSRRSQLMHQHSRSSHQVFASNSSKSLTHTETHKLNSPNIEHSSNDIQRGSECSVNGLLDYLSCIVGAVMYGRPKYAQAWSCGKQNVIDAICEYQVGVMDDSGIVSEFCKQAAYNNGGKLRFIFGIF